MTTRLCQGCISLSLLSRVAVHYLYGTTSRWVHVTQRGLGSRTLVDMQPTVSEENLSGPYTLSNTVIPHFGSTQDSKDFEESTSASHRQQMSGTVEHSSALVIIR